MTRFSGCLRIENCWDFTLSGIGESVYHIIPEGNYSGFGSYGYQSGDGDASISSARQQQITADPGTKFLQRAVTVQK